MRAETRVILFASVLAIVCSLLLTGAELLLKPFRDANERAEQIRNYLSALDIPVAEGSSANELIETFENNVSVDRIGELELYTYIPANVSQSNAQAKPQAYAVPFSGPGLWGPIYGVLALEPDFTTIRGIRFFKQEETPGLGGEIGATWFQEQFKHKQIISSTGEYGFQIVKPGSAVDNNQVDGITGATMTSERVGVMIDSVVKKLGEERQNNVK